MAGRDSDARFARAPRPGSSSRGYANLRTAGACTPRPSDPDCAVVVVAVAVATIGVRGRWLARRNGTDHAIVAGGTRLIHSRWGIHLHQLLRSAGPEGAAQRPLGALGGFVKIALGVPHARGAARVERGVNHVGDVPVAAGDDARAPSEWITGFSPACLWRKQCREARAAATATAAVAVAVRNDSP